MNETVIKNEQLGITLVKTELNNVNVVLAEDVRKALKWDSVPHMVRGLKEGKEVIKVRISDLDKGFKGFLPSLAKTSNKGGRPMTYAYFLTRQGVSRLIATRRPHDVKDDPALSDWLDQLQDWIFGDVLPEVLSTGQYTGRPLEAGRHAIDSFPTSLSGALRMMADEYDSHTLTIDAWQEAVRTKAQISDNKTATALAKASVYKMQFEKIEKENIEIKREASNERARADANEAAAIHLESWKSNISKGLLRHYRGKNYDKSEPGFIQPDLFADDSDCEDDAISS